MSINVIQNNVYFGDKLVQSNNTAVVQDLVNSVIAHVGVDPTKDKSHWQVRSIHSERKGLRHRKAERNSALISEM